MIWLERITDWFCWENVLYSPVDQHPSSEGIESLNVTAVVHPDTRRSSSTPMCGECDKTAVYTDMFIKQPTRRNILLKRLRRHVGEHARRLLWCVVWPFLLFSYVLLLVFWHLFWIRLNQLTWSAGSHYALLRCGRCVTHNPLLCAHSSRRLHKSSWK